MMRIFSYKDRERCFSSKICSVNARSRVNICNPIYDCIVVRCVVRCQYVTWSYWWVPTITNILSDWHLLDDYAKILENIFLRNFHRTIALAEDVITHWFVLMNHRWRVDRYYIVCSPIVCFWRYEEMRLIGTISNFTSCQEGKRLRGGLRDFMKKYGL